jgi:hypothetical protein
LEYLKANDRRIILFGGADYTTKHPAGTYYEVLDTKTYQWHHNNNGISLRAPYKGHTATLVDDYMFIAFGNYNYLFIFVQNEEYDCLLYKFVLPL